MQCLYTVFTILLLVYRSHFFYNIFFFVLLESSLSPLALSLSFPSVIHISWYLKEYFISTAHIVLDIHKYKIFFFLPLFYLFRTVFYFCSLFLSHSILLFVYVYVAFNVYLCITIFHLHFFSILVLANDSCLLILSSNTILYAWKKKTFIFISFFIHR